MVYFFMGILVRLTVILFIFSPLQGCNQNNWTGFVYLDKENPEMFKKTEIFKTYDNCRSAAWTLLLEANAVDKGYIECGMNCEVNLVATTGYSCEKIVRNLY